MSWANTSKDILDQEKQPIYVKNIAHSTKTLTTSSLKPAGEANMYVHVVYAPHKIFKHNQGQVSASTNADPFNKSKQVNNQ